ncbi:MBL fold metallo-hydrolase [Paenibacillus macerans]|uniref:MBL fold metallo-hydrolase n=1 Tax=Paenibacillus macerans TaxID=44252 RepID=UPI00204023C8|nr:MBL fold metallo-hydrolase [Paenibacillus macerans]MCM3703854.1 MBL fold metallo-hydrolase [Paenibacillus macerans]
MKLQLVRHATLWLEYANRRFLIDPMLGDAGSKPPIDNTPNERRNPLVPMPQPAEHWLRPGLDAVIVTHLHPDHWDEAAVEKLPKDILVLCQPGDEEALRSSGFTRVTAIQYRLELEGPGVSLTRTGGRHGTGEIGQRMGRVSGFVFRAPDEPSLYLAGDTIWCDEVKQALDLHHPDISVVNAGGARFNVGGPITMDAEQIVELCRYNSDTQVIAVHMEAINHCLVTRSDLRQRLETEDLLQRVTIPEDGQWV